MIRAMLLLSTLIVLNVKADDFYIKIVEAAKERTEHFVVYNGSYRKIDYPNGDVPKNIGVCTDVVIRTYRALGIDLQALVYEDMRDNFSLYPSKRIWGLTKPDTNIDHRRVPNLQVFFERHGESHVISKTAADYQAGDIVTWVLPNNRPHIGIVTDELSKDKLRPLIVHNIGWGPKMEDMLFTYKITGHYRFKP
ncbi:UNVERIFIED_CONTAM: yijF [Trichonephila clavipes]